MPCFDLLLPAPAGVILTVIFYSPFAFSFTRTCGGDPDDYQDARLS